VARTSAIRTRPSRRVPPGRKLALIAANVPLKAMKITVRRRSVPRCGSRTANSTTSIVK